MSGRRFGVNVVFLAGIAGAVVLVGNILSLNIAKANNTSVVDKIHVAVPQSCMVEGTITSGGEHTKIVQNNTYYSEIGTTTFKTYCNDNEGYVIYAVGFSNDEVGNTLMKHNLNGTNDFDTGTATSGNTSDWAMKLSPIAGAYAPTIHSDANGAFSSYHVVPNEYAKVVTFASNTDLPATGINAAGSGFTSTYAAWISATQAAGTYTGKVKYTLVHPSTVPIPRNTMLDTGQVVGGKMKTLAAGAETAYNAQTSDIKAIRMADSLPSGFVATEANTVSTSTSTHPIYIFFDNTNDAGIMYFYTGGYQVIMNPDSAQMFRSNLALADISGLELWDSSNVTSMLAIFVDDVALTNLNALARWDTSNLESLYGAFGTNTATITAGYSSALSDISALANWNTSNVSNMSSVFQNLTSLEDLSPLASWNTSKVTNMTNMFTSIAATNLDALADWDVSKVERMDLMFGVGASVYNIGVRSHLTDISGLANWNTESVQNMSTMFQLADKITSLDALADWDVGNVVNMQNMFRYTYGLIDASGIKNWNVTKVTATAGASSSSKNNFYFMFNNSAATPEPFTLRAGTWNANGTYVPSA